MVITLPQENTSANIGQQPNDMVNLSMRVDKPITLYVINHFCLLFGEQLH